MKKVIGFLVLLCAVALGVHSLAPVPQTGFVAAYARAESEERLLLINADHPLPEDYSVNLVNLYAQKNRAFQLSASDILIDGQVFEAMNRMFSRAKNDGVKGFIVTSGHRTREKQQRVYDESAPGLAALPGTSEHESGLAFDVTCLRDDGRAFERTKQFKWLSENCWDFGFIIRYPEGKEHITGIEYEPWHYRYVGVDAAQSMRDSGQTLEEYLEAW